MSLNKFTDGSVQKPWMNINAATVKADLFEVADLKSASITCDTIDSATIGGDVVVEGVEMKDTKLYLRNNTEINYRALYIINDFGGGGSFAFRNSTFDDCMYIDKLDAVPNEGSAVGLFKICNSGEVRVMTANAKLFVDQIENSTTGGIDIETIRLDSGTIANVLPSSAVGSFYEQFTSVGNNYSGALTLAILKEYSAVRVGNLVTVNIGSLLAACSVATTITSSVALPVNLRPQQGTRFCVELFDNNVSVVGFCLVSATTGLIQFIPVSGNYTPLGNGGFSQVMVTYSTF